MVKKVLTFFGIAFLIFFIAFNPGAAKDVFASLWETIKDVGAGFGGFFIGLVS